MLSLGVAAVYTCRSVWKVRSTEIHAKLNLSSPSLDLGDGLPSSEMVGEIEISNTGVAPLNYEITKLCNCTAVTPQSGSLEPGATVDVKVTLRLDGKFGTEKQSAIIIRSNDPLNPDVRVPIVGRCPAPIVVEPAQLDFGVIAPGEQRSLDCRIALTDHGRTRGRDIRMIYDKNILNVSPDQFSFDDDARAVLRVTMTAKTRGQMLGFLTIFQGDSRYEFDIPVCAMVRNSVDCNPASVRFPSSGKKQFELTTIVWRSTTDDLGEPDITELPAGVELTVLPGQGRFRRWRLVFSEEFFDSHLDRLSVKLVEGGELVLPLLYD